MGMLIGIAELFQFKLGKVAAVIMAAGSVASTLLGHCRSKKSHHCKAQDCLLEQSKRAKASASAKKVLT